MKKTFTLGLALLVFLLGNINSIFAERGDLISHEVLDYFESEDVVDFFVGQFDNYVDPEDMPEFFELATAFFSQLIDQRNMTVHKMVYETVDFYGNYAEASGIILIPGHENFTCSRSFSLYAHGTIFNRESVNSRPQNWGGEFMLTLMMASINTICVAPDYYGLGDGDGFHHHNTYRTNVNSSIDAVRAGRHLCDELGVEYNNRLMPMGYSEGGHASMGIARMVKEEGLQSEFIIPFVGAGSGAYDMSDEAYNFILVDPYYITPQYILYQAATCEDIYGNIILEEEGETYSDFLVPPYDQLFVDHVLSQDGNMGWVVRPWTEMFQPDKIEEYTNDPQNALRQCLANSNVYDWNNRYPTLMYYCTTDGQVPYTCSIKTRDVQRSLIPWFLFWERFKIQALDLTLGDLIPSHEACALPSIFIQIAVMDKTLGLECTYTGREAAIQRSALRTVSGERLDRRIIYSSKNLDLADIAHGERRAVSGVNMQTGTVLNASDGTVRIEENGFYLFRIDQADGTSDVTWLYKADPDFVSTEDYDPIRNNPMRDRTIVDLSLLEEAVREVAVLDMDGNEHFAVSLEPGADRAEILRSASMTDGDYLVEVRTAQNNYPLQLEVRSQPDDSPIGVFPNPVTGKLKAEWSGCSELPNRPVQVDVIDAGGRIVLSEQVSLEDCRFELDVLELKPGMYTLRATGAQTVSRTFIRAGR